MVLVSGIILYQFRSSYHEKVTDHLGELVQKHKQNIDTFLRSKSGDIRFLSRSFTLEQLKDEAFLESCLAKLHQEYEPVIVDLGVIEADGMQVAYAGPFKLGQAQYADADWFQKAMQSEYTISDVFLGLRNLPHFIVAVKNESNGSPWILRATIDFAAFSELVKNIRIGRTGFAFIVNREGEIQTKGYLDAITETGPYLDLLSDPNPDINRIHHIEAADESGTDYLYVSAFLKNGDWLLICRQDASDAFSDFQKAFSAALAIILVCCLGVVSTAFLISKRMLKRFAQVDREKKIMSQQIVETGKLASVGELAAGIAHEINNPVAIMVEEAGWIEDLLEEEDLKGAENLEEFTRALQQIKNQGSRCKQITHKLLSFARKTESRIQELDIHEFVEEMVSLSSQRAKYSKVAIDVSLPSSLPTLRVSLAEMQQVFLNLINNALDAMEKEGGTLDITVQREDNLVVFYVADTGPGIPEANLERIFDPFFTTKPVGKGTGLGLSICYGIIKKMGGEIEVRSVVGAGTTFRVEIPLQNPEEHPEESEMLDQGPMEVRILKENSVSE
jgi:two-component system NtrC family sensor kinase